MAHIEWNNAVTTVVGSKVFITNGWNADVVLVVAITDKEAE